MKTTLTLNIYLRFPNFVIKMETECAAEEYSLTWKGHIQHVRQSFSKLLQSSDFCDVTLYVEGQKIGAHKILLTACSDYFNKLFDDLKDDRPIIVLKGIRIDILQLILRFVYHGQVSIEMDKLSAFLEAGEFLKIHGLINNETLRKRTESIVGEADINTEDEQNCMSGCQTSHLNTQNLEEHSLTSEVDTPVQKDNFQTRSEHMLAERLLQYQGYGFFKEKRPLRRIHKSNIVENITLNQEPVLSVKDTQETVYQEPLVENKKYTSVSPKRTGDWTSDYIFDENQSQSTQSSIPEVESPLAETVHDQQTQSDCSLSKRKRIKLQRPSCNLEDVAEINQFDEQDFANGLDAEIGMIIVIFTIIFLIIKFGGIL